MNGILIVDKPKGLTSHDIVDSIRRKFKLKRVGHAGFLDPAATGVLVILIGTATKFSNLFTNADKEYLVKCLLGVVTDTDDLDGQISVKTSHVKINRQEFEKALSNFKGKIKQKVPRFSAVKLKGKKLYQLARKGQGFELPEKEVSIYAIEIIEFDLPEVSLRIVCSKGTYMRAFCRDLGAFLGCGGCVSALRRIQSGPFSINDAVEFENLKTLNTHQLVKLLKPISDYESLQKFVGIKNG